uniref:C-type lectin domain-containing protein n=1 Tax=Nothobranchius furzeri TaxID=105023 RepID=A0A8C6LL62_NOTFU
FCLSKIYLGLLLGHHPAVGLYFPLCHLSGCLQVCDLQLVRQFRYISLYKTWSDAQTYCRDQFSDLATIQNIANNTQAQHLAGISNFWIGLFNGSWKWSQEESQGVPFSTWFTNWGFSQPQSGDCVVINSLGFWFSHNCEELYQSLTRVIFLHLILQTELVFFNS